MKQAVIILHGLARTSRAMNAMAKAIKNQGYHCINQGYPSTKMSVEVLAPLAIDAALKQCSDAERIHFVTHSMGGILLRQYLSQTPIDKLTRVVMLGPPNQGCEIVDRLKSWPLFRWYNGPAGLQLGTDELSIVKRLAAIEEGVNYELGVIAGSRSYNPLLSSMLPSPSDGKVSVASTELIGMKAHICLPVSHTFMMSNKQVIAQTLYFLQQGRFD